MSAAVKQLQKDLAYLQKNPIVGANAEPFGDNIFKWYGIVVGSETSPFPGVPVRFIMEFPEDYPNSPPKAFFDTYFAYQGGAVYMVEGRLAVCLNIFGNFGHVHTEWKNQSEGWTPAYTVSTILITMQGLLMSFSHDAASNTWYSEMLSTCKEDIQKTIKEATNFKCPITGHDGSDSSKWFPQVILSQDDLVQRMKDFGISPEDQKYNPMRDFYVCYVTKNTASEGALLGYGIHVENPKTGALSSPCEYLSQEAFNTGTRNSSTNKPFEFWMPIMTSSESWNSVKALFVKSVQEIAKGIGYNQKLPLQIVKVCASLMNTLVVEVMNNKNNLTANDKFIHGYFALYRLMKQFGADDSEIVKFCDEQLYRFVSDSTKRSKKDMPNLGELLIYLTVASKITWNDLAIPFQEECDARNFFWYACGTRFQPAQFQELKNPKVVDGRAEKVFSATVVSRNLVCFQVQFSRMATQMTLESMNSNFGLAPDMVLADLKGAYQKITAITSWDGYFDWLGMPRVNSADRSKQLVTAVEVSRKNGYHK